jgi:hypothetical protein
MKYRILLLSSIILLLFSTSCRQDYDKINKVFSSVKGNNNITFVLVGDSSSGSEGSETSSSYGTFLKQKMSSYFGTQISMVNSSRTDETFDRARRHMAEDVLTFRPDVTLIMLGLTDSCENGVYLQFFKDVVSEYFKEINATGIFSILLTATGFSDLKPGDGAFDRLKEFNDTISFQARLNHIPVIDVARYMEEMRQNKPEEYKAMFKDRIHLNDRGLNYIADYIFETIRDTMDHAK